MCVISAVPRGISLSEEVLQTMWRRNDDGAGFMYAEDGKLYIEKGFMTYEAFKEAYAPHAGKQMVLHFRIKTHGALNEENTHPFQVDETLAFAHNGIISGYGSNSHSDTWHFNAAIIQPLRQKVSNFLTLQPIQDLLSARIGHSKLVFMDNEGNIQIINKDMGNESSDGVWFSNTSWIPPKVHVEKKTTEKAPILTLPSKRGGSAHSLAVGDLVFVYNDYHKVKKGELGVVQWFGNGALVGIRFLGELTDTPIPHFYIQKAQPLEFNCRVGHFQKGDVVFQDYFEDEKTIHVLDPLKKKFYYIPKDSVQDGSYLNLPADMVENIFDAGMGLSSFDADLPLYPTGYGLH